MEAEGEEGVPPRQLAHTEEERCGVPPERHAPARAESTVGPMQTEEERCVGEQREPLKGRPRQRRNTVAGVARLQAAQAEQGAGSGQGGSSARSVGAMEGEEEADTGAGVGLLEAVEAVEAPETAVQTAGALGVRDAHPPVGYHWQVGVDGRTRRVVGVDAMTDNLMDGDVRWRSYGRRRQVGKMQLQAAIAALQDSIGCRVTAPSGDKTALQRQLQEWRARVRVHREAAANAQTAQAELVGMLEAAQQEALPAGEDGGAAASVPPPLSADAAQRTWVEIQRTRVRRAELWAADWLLGEDGDELRRPSPVPILDGVPYRCRELVLSRYCKCIQDLKWA
jgi:hypothetical protein